MTFFEAVWTCLRKYADFNGRAARPEYWWFFLFVNVVCWPAVELDRQLGAIFFWATILPHMAAAVRRLHDTGRSGWYILVGSIPFLGWIALALLLLQDSRDPGDHVEPSTSVATFDDFVEGNGVSFPMTLREGVMQMLAFYQKVSSNGCDGEEGDMLLFQWGTYDWGEGTRFEVNIARQFIESALEDDHAISQLQLTFNFPASAGTASLGSGNRWCKGPSEVDGFRDFILTNQAFLAEADTDPPRVHLHHEYV